MELIGSVGSLHRYPVKSMVGENLDTAIVSKAGVPGDRAWAVRNLDVGEQQGARKMPALLGLVATTAPEDEVTSPWSEGFPQSHPMKSR